MRFLSRGRSLRARPVDPADRLPIPAPGRRLTVPRTGIAWSGSESGPRSRPDRFERQTDQLPHRCGPGPVARPFHGEACELGAPTGRFASVPGATKIHDWATEVASARVDDPIAIDALASCLRAPAPTRRSPSRPGSRDPTTGARRNEPDPLSRFSRPSAAAPSPVLARPPLQPDSRVRDGPVSQGPPASPFRCDPHHHFPPRPSPSRNPRAFFHEWINTSFARQSARRHRHVVDAGAAGCHHTADPR